MNITDKTAGALLGRFHLQQQQRSRPERVDTGRVEPLFQQRKRREFIPETMKDQTYWDRRRRNNEAAKRSREKRRINDLLLEARLAELHRENAALRAELAEAQAALHEATRGHTVPPPAQETTPQQHLLLSPPPAGYFGYTPQAFFSPAPPPASPLNLSLVPHHHHQEEVPFPPGSSPESSSPSSFFQESLEDSSSSSSSPPGEFEGFLSPSLLPHKLRLKHRRGISDDIVNQVKKEAED